MSDGGSGACRLFAVGTNSRSGRTSSTVIEPKSITNRQAPETREAGAVCLIVYDVR